MSNHEDFFSRWSRRKRGMAQSADQSKQSGGEARGKSDDAAVAQHPAAAQTGPAFDPTMLPPIESITAETDIRDFLAPSVPPALMRAALRRVWTTDLKIRDFVGLADYAWDFNAPGSMAGFGVLEPTDAVRRQVADLIGRGATEDHGGDNLDSREVTQHLKATNATHDEREKPDEPPHIAPRRHGQALPE